MASLMTLSEDANFSLIASAIDHDDSMVLSNLVKSGIHLWPAVASDSSTSHQHLVEEGDTPLVYAARAGNLGAVKCITEYYFDRDDKKVGAGSGEIFTSDAGNFSYVYHGSYVEHHKDISCNRCLENDTEVSHEDCSFYDILDWRNKQGETALVAAAARGHQAVVEYLILNGAEAFHCSCFAVVSCMEAGSVCWRGFKALDIAAERGDVEMIDCLLDAVTNINAPDRHGKKALIHFTCFGYTDVIKVLIDRGANLDEASRSGWTPLMCAVVTHKSEMVKCFLDNGADPNLVDRRGNNVLHLALQWSSEPLDDVRILLSHGVNVKVKNNAGYTPLMLAHSSEVVHMLMRAGALVNLELHFAVLTGHTRAVQAMLQNGTVPQVKNISSLPSIVQEWVPHELQNMSPLEAALVSGHIDIAEYFICNWFLTQYDMSQLFWNESLWNFVESQGYHDRMTMLAEYRGSPWSLAVQSFVLISSCLGEGPGRRARVKCLNLPPVLQRKLLLFDEDNVNICRDIF